MRTHIAVLALTTLALPLSMLHADPDLGPLSLTNEALPLEAVAMLTLDGPDYDTLWQEDRELDAKGNPWRFAVPHRVDVTPLHSASGPCSTTIACSGNCACNPKVR